MNKTIETTYFYKKSEGSDDVSLERTVTKETIDDCDCNDCDSGELLIGEPMTIDCGRNLTAAALTIASVSLCIAAIVSVFRHD